MPKLARPNAEQDPDPIDIAIGLRIRARRKAMRVTQPSLGEHLGLSFQQIQKYELGVNRISGANLVRVARALKCSVADLAEGPEEGRSSSQGFELLVERGVVELIDAYRAIPTAGHKKLLVDMARALAAKIS